MGNPGGLPSLGSHRVGHDCSDLAAVAADHWLCLNDRKEVESLAAKSFLKDVFIDTL